MDQPAKLHPAVATVIIILIVAAMTSGVAFVASRTGSSDQSSETAMTGNREISPQSSSGNYRNGTYTAPGDYFSPGGRETIQLSVTIEDGVIASSELETEATSGDSKEFQDKFASGYKELVVGKNVNDVSLDRVAGSSLTPSGFNKALEKIKDDARV